MSQRYRSCGRGSGCGRLAVGVPLRRRPSARRGRASAPWPASASRSTCGVAVLLVELPRHQHDRVAPAGRAVQLLEEAGPLGDRHRRHVVEVAVVPLGGGEVAQPLPGEAVDVVEVRRRRDEQLPVAGPAGALARRAVGRDVAGVAAEAPHRRLVQPVDAGRRCTRRSRARSRSVCTTTPVTSSAVSGPGWPSTRTYRKPCVVNRGSNDVALDAGRDDAVDLAGASAARAGTARPARGGRWSRRRRVRAPRRGSARSRCPAGPRLVEPDPAVDVLAEVDDVHARAQLGDRRPAAAPRRRAPAAPAR